MPSTTKFCSVADVKPLLGDATAWTGDDALIDGQIQTATALLRAYTRRIWEKAQYTDYFSTQTIMREIGVGSNYSAYYLKEKPLSTIASEAPVVKYSTGGEWANAVPLQATTYEIDYNASKVIFYPYHITANGRVIQVTYYAGYPVNVTDPTILDVSTALKQACIIQAAFSTRRIINATSGASSTRGARRGLAFTSTVSGLMPEALALVKDNTRVLVGSHG